ncbi:MAG: hypothetical protein HC853_09560 [Anaerolineae bacterium]|nr:hypothetical protein [Anaerolineae bacterium]
MSTYSLSVVTLFLFVLIALAYAFFYRKNHRRAYAIMAYLLVMLLVSTPALQAIATDLNAKYHLGLPTLSELLGFPKTANAASTKVAELMAPLQQTPSQTNALISKCGQGTGADTDGDILTDLDEGCLGTNPYSTDTDFDVLPDNFEVTNFTVGARQWSLNPTKTDSNDDGLNDFIELPSTDVQLTINNVITTVKVGGAPVNANSPSRFDWDNDGVPNVWDDDNDGDGVIDSLDLSPFAVGSQQKEFRVKTQGAGYTGTQYIEVQLQPADLSHLRYGLTAFDWPKDDLGGMRDYEGVGKGLVRLQPFLEVIVNKEAMPRTYAKDYGVALREDIVDSANKYRSFYVGLQPIGNGGAVNAFYSKLAFAPGELNNIDLRARLVWFAQGDSQENISGTIKINSTLLHVYKDEVARVTGLKITKSEQAETLIVGDPNSPQEDRYLAGAAVGMNMFYLARALCPRPQPALAPCKSTPRVSIPLPLREICA